MTYVLLAAVVTLTAFALVVGPASVIVTLAAPAVVARSARFAPASRAAMLLAVRLLPSTLGAAVALGLALPAFLWYEEFDPSEAVGPTLALTSLLGVLFLVRGAVSLVRAHSATSAVVRRWEARSRPLDLVPAPMAASVVETSEPVVALAGGLRPRLYVARVVRDLCTPDELSAIVAHESAHAGAYDNVKRALIRGCPDVADPRGVLERSWSAAAEQAADAAVVAARPELALDLAQALITVARLTLQAPLPLASALSLPDGLDARVRRLTDPPAGERVLPIGRCAVAGVAMVCSLGTVAVLSAHAVHELVEIAVRALP